MSTFRLQIASFEYTSSDIMDWNGMHEDPFVEEVLRVCRQWLDGEEHFSMQTSGSTGTPKTIDITRAQIIASAQKSLSFFDLKPSDTALCPLSMNVVGGKMMVFRSLIGGLILHVIKADRTLSGMSLHQYDFMPVSSLQLHEILLHHPEKIQVLNTFRHILIGGGAISPALEELISKRLICSVWQSYGMTETVSHIALRQISPVKDKMYTLLKGISIDTDERICLKVCGDVTNHEWIQTNDVVDIQDESHFTFVGRADFVINSGGIKIHTEALEQQITQLFNEHSISGSFFISGIKDDAYGEKVVLVMNEAIIAEQKILQLLKTSLPLHQAPKEVYVLPFIYSESGKINRIQTLQQIKC